MKLDLVDYFAAVGALIIVVVSATMITSAKRIDERKETCEKVLGGTFVCNTCLKTEEIPLENK